MSSLGTFRSYPPTISVAASGTATVPAILVGAGLQSSPSIALSTMPTTGIYFPNTGAVAITVGGLARFSVDVTNGLATLTLPFGAPWLSPNPAGTVAVNVAYSGGTYLNNSGASTTYNLPAAAANGGKYTFACTTAASVMVIKANGTDVIQIPGGASNAGGTLTSSTAGACVTLHSVATGLWIATSALGGTWATA